MISNDVVNEMKAAVDKMYSYLGILGARTDVVQTISKATGRDDVDLATWGLMDMAEYLIYLSSSDGTITLEESDLITRVCGLELSHREIVDHAKENNIYSKNYERRPPTSLIVTVWVDNSLYDSARASGKLDQLYGNYGGPKAFISEPIINTYKYVGAEFLKARKTTTRSEIQDYEIYTKMLDDYLADNFLGA